MRYASGGLLNYLMRGDPATDIFCNGPVEDTLFKVIAWQKGPRREYTDMPRAFSRFPIGAPSTVGLTLGLPNYVVLS